MARSFNGQPMSIREILIARQAFGDGLLRGTFNCIHNPKREFTSLQELSRLAAQTFPLPESVVFEGFR